MSFHRQLSLALLALVLALAVLVPVLGSTETHTQGSDDAAPLAGWRLRDHEANHTGNGTEPDPDHDHDHDHGNGTEHHHEEEALHEIFAMFDQDNDTLLSEHELELLHAAMFPEFEHDHEHDHDHDHDHGNETHSDGEEDHDHAHNRRQRIGAMIRQKISASSGKAGSGGLGAASAGLTTTTEGHSAERAEGGVGGGEGADAGAAAAGMDKRELTEAEFELYCLTPEALFTDYDADADGFLSEEEFMTMTPQLVLMVLKGCGEAHAHEEEVCVPPEEWESWLAGLGSVAIICLVSLIGIALIPFTVSQKHKIMGEIHNLVVMLMISFAVGALIGDAVLHLMPEVLEVHSHSGGGHDEHAHEEHSAEEDDHDDKSYLEPLALVLVGVFFFFFIEKMLLLVLGKEIQHGHGLQKESSNSSDDELEMDEAKDKAKAKEDAENECEACDEDDLRQRAGFKGRIRRFGSNQVELMKTVKTYGWLNLISDVFHNFVDGLAIGSAYSQSLSMGLSTSLAVAFHEIPQELGDYGVLIKAGFTKPWALAFNFITACTAFLGVIIGLGVGRAVTDANKWILAFTAGGFFYIALADLMPELNSHPRKGWMGLLDVGVQFFGVLLGFGIMAIIAVTESEHDC